MANQFGKRIREHRPVIVFGALISLSLVSIASGAEGGPVARGVSSVAATATRPFLQAMNAAQQGVAYVSGLVFERGALAEENRSLRQTFQVMMQHAAERNEFASENDRLRNILDFQREHPEYELMPVEVLQHTQGLLTIDRGSLDGLRESLCVVTEDGVIGMIVRVDLMTSVVATLQDADCRVDAMIDRTRVRGTVHGSTTDLSHICELRYVELKHEIRPGDRVVTSPDSVFPTGFPIGVVESVEYDPGSLWKSAAVRPAADPYSVDEVLVVLRTDTDWREMAGESEPEPSEQLTSFSENQTIQERYAP